ncbi:MAG: hypothetical protein ACRDJ0_15540 [Actinomycetota bacterium]
MQTASTPLFACVTENTPEWFEKARNLLLSMREFGGAWKDSPVVVSFVGSVEPKFERALTRLGAEVQVVAPYGARYRFSNKMRMFDLFDESRDFDVLVALDCDVLVMGDLSPLVPADAVGVVPAGRDLMNLDQWETVYQMFDLTPPEHDCVMRISGRRTYPYYNTGVVSIPRAMGAELESAWTDILGNFGPVHERFARVHHQRVHHENQIAFALAILMKHLPLRELTASLNYSTAAPLDRRFRDELKPPFIVHYHQAIDGQGFIKGSPSKRVDRVIDEFNRFRARELGLTYEQLAGVPLMTRVQKSAQTRSWYKTNTVRRLRRSVLGKAVKRVSAAGARRT